MRCLQCRRRLRDSPNDLLYFIVMRLLKLSPFLIAVLGLIAPVSAQTAAPTPPGEIVVLHDVVTGKGGGRDLHAEIAYPKNATGLLPAVIYIHGGGWIG